MREHNEAVNRLDVIPAREAIKIEQEAGGTLDVVQHDGSYSCDRNHVFPARRSRSQL